MSIGLLIDGNCTKSKMVVSMPLELYWYGAQLVLLVKQLPVSIQDTGAQLGGGRGEASPALF